jgi:hypothetical protein
MPSATVSSGSRTYAAATTTQTIPDLRNLACRGIKVFLKVTAIGTGNITLTINHKNPADGTYVLALAGAAVAGNTVTTYTVYPTGIAAVANVTAVDAITEYVQLVITANNANPVDYTVGWVLLP